MYWPFMLMTRVLVLSNKLSITLGLLSPQSMTAPCFKCRDNLKSNEEQPLELIKALSTFFHWLRSQKWNVDNTRDNGRGRRSATLAMRPCLPCDERAFANFFFATPVFVTSSDAWHLARHTVLASHSHLAHQSPRPGPGQEIIPAKLFSFSPHSAFTASSWVDRATLH